MHALTKANTFVGVAKRQSRMGRGFLHPRGAMICNAASSMVSQTSSCRGKTGLLESLQEANSDTVRLPSSLLLNLGETHRFCIMLTMALSAGFDTDSATALPDKLALSKDRTDVAKPDAVARRRVEAIRRGLVCRSKLSRMLGTEADWHITEDHPTVNIHRANRDDRHD